MKILVIENNRKVIKDMQFSFRIPWPDVVIVSTEEGQKGIELVEAELPDVVTIGSTLTDMGAGKLILFSLQSGTNPGPVC